MSELTLDALLEKKGAAAEEAPKTDEVSAEAAAEQLTPEQQAKVEEIRKNIDLTDSNTLMQYGIADLETLRKVNDDLIATINDSIRIQQEGHDARVSAEKELVSIEGELKKALMQAKTAGAEG